MKNIILCTIWVLISLMEQTETFAQISKREAIDSVMISIIAEDTLNYNIYMNPVTYADDWYYICIFR